MKHKYLVGMYDDDDTMLDGVKKLRKAGYQIHEAYTPFPVHGLDTAMGLQDTRLHTIGFVIGAIGTILAISCMGSITALDWPINVGGKPFFSFPAFVPITFEVTVLFASVGMVVIMYLRNGFSIFREPEIVDPRFTDDRFGVVYCLKKYTSKADIDGITNIMKSTGAVEIKERVLDNELRANGFKKESGSIELGHH